MSRLFSGTAKIILAAILWSTGGVFVKSISADPILITALRSAIAGIVLLPFIRPKQLKLSWQLLLLIFCYGGLCICYVSATKLTAAANAIALEFTAPLWIFIVSAIYNKKVEWSNILPMILITIWLGTIMAEPNEGSTTLGNLIGIGAGVFFAATTVLMGKAAKENSIGVVSICNLAAAPLIWLLVPDGCSIVGITFQGWLALICMGVLQVGAGYAFYALGLRTTSSQKATMIALLEPIFNPIWVAIFVHEIPTIYGIIGGVFILFGMVADIIIRARIRGSGSDVSLGGDIFTKTRF